MSKYRKKPIVIEAEQWWPPSDSRHEASMLKTYAPGEQHMEGDLWLGIPGGPPLGGGDVFMIRTLEGDLKVSPGDWIIQAPIYEDEDGNKCGGEAYPCKPDIFAATYDPV